MAFVRSRLVPATGSSPESGLAICLRNIASAHSSKSEEDGQLKSLRGNLLDFIVYLIVLKCLGASNVGATACMQHSLYFVFSLFTSFAGS